ncbi:uncharacterized protein [Rutidosis leptorrhynchoides]|uniref:uncharacterized protein n=1 Tax=Rutidosis leptorrhynchoides TaxID=125765 RepID=UPI003A99D5C1
MTNTKNLLCIQWALLWAWLNYTIVASLGSQVEAPVVMNKKCIDKERYALLDFKALILKDPHDLLSTWGTKEEDDNCCEWSGVTCNNQTYHVTELQLNGYNLEGEISPSLFNLTYLTHLDLSSNLFHGTIPKSIGSLTELTYLDLSNNSFIGIIPSVFGNLISLEQLSLGEIGRCRVENLDWLSNLTHLDILEMNGVSLAKANYWVNIVASLQNLTSLNFRGCNLSQVMHPYSSSSFDNSTSSSIYALKLRDNNLNYSSISHWLFPLISDSLRVLDLSGNALDGIPKFLGNICNLDALYISGNSAMVPFSDFLKNLSGCTPTYLGTLEAYGSQFTGTNTDEIHLFSSLSTLDLHHNKLTGNISDKLWELINLSSLDLSSNSLGGALYTNYEKSKISYTDSANNSPPTMLLSRFDHLNLSSNNITGSIPDFFTNSYSRLRVMDLSSNSFNGLVTNVSSSLGWLDLSSNKFHGGISFVCQIYNWSLTHLDLSNNSFSGPLTDCLWNFQDLKVLNLRYNIMTNTKNLLCIHWALLWVWLNYTIVASLGSQVEAAVVMNKKCIEKERHALLDFKALILKDPYDALSTWGTKEEDDDCCEWSGVTCNNQTFHVTELQLNGYDLEGEISPSLFNLTYLTHLDLGANSLHGTIPSSIGSLSELSYLDLSYNQFHGTISTFIGSLRHLVLWFVDLSYNSFSGTIPTSIGSLIELSYVDLSYNSFNGTIPTSIGFLTQLSHLKLSSNYFHGTIPTSIGALTELAYLDLSNNSFTGTIPSEFGNLISLEQLSLGEMGRCRVENLDWLSNLTHLDILEMSGVSLAKANYWVNIVTSLHNLTSLNLGGCNLSRVMHPYSSSSSSFDNSTSSSTIIYLILRDNNLNYSSISHWLFPLISNSLVVLDLSNNVLDGIPKFLGNICNLDALYINGNSAMVPFSDFLKNLSGCTPMYLSTLEAYGSQFTGPLSDEIHLFSSLTTLDLHQNQLTGNISEKVWELIGLSNLDLSSNSLGGALYTKSEKSKKLLDMDSSNNSLPTMLLYSFDHLNLSSNNITGSIPDLFTNNSYSTLRVMDLSSNSFNGLVTNVASALGWLDLSSNKFHGGISFLCQISNLSLTHLDLSNNSFSGPLPDCLWNFQNLKVLNLRNNKLSGRLLSTNGGVLSALEVFFFNNNNFSGELPLSLGNFTKLTFLDLGNNHFSGYVPTWIGKLSGLYILSLSSNDFFGPTPPQLCQLVNLQILDLSMNNLNETIPSCINNLSAMVRTRSLTTHDIPQYEHNYSYQSRTISETINYVDHAMIQWLGYKREFSGNLRFLKSIDLSSNNLTGKIPDELCDLHGLVALNLSTNALVGEIPRKINEMKELLTLDLSRNNLSGGLPLIMSEMNLLNYIDVSYNSLSGRIPSGTQFQTSKPTWYVGNLGLCGPPNTNHCPGDIELQPTPPIGESEGEHKDNIELWRLFYIGGTTGFAIGFWIVCSALLVNRRGRHTFCHFLERLEDWVHVKVSKVS